jgi:hypothetical protein
MRMDEEKALRLRRTRLMAELARINILLDDWDANSTKGTVRDEFYKDAENDFRNSDSNGNYITPEGC